MALLSVGGCEGREICLHLLEGHGEVGRAELARLVHGDVHARGHQLAHGRAAHTDGTAHAHALHAVAIHRTRKDHHRYYLRARASLGHAMGFRCTYDPHGQGEEGRRGTHAEAHSRFSRDAIVWGGLQASTASPPSRPPRAPLTGSLAPWPAAARAPRDLGPGVSDLGPGSGPGVGGTSSGRQATAGDTGVRRWG